MAASKAQGSYFGLFVAGSAVLCGGIAYINSITGKVVLLVGAGILLASLAGFLKIKPLEGETPLRPGPEAMKWIGAGICVLGWGVTITGLHLVDGNGGRIVAALLGIGLSLFGMLYVLPATFNKTAFWKQPAATSLRNGYTAVAGRATVEPELTAAPTAMRAAK